MGREAAGQPRQVQLRSRRGGVLPGQQRRLRSVQGRRVRLLHRAPGKELGQWLSFPGHRPWRGDTRRNPPPDPDPDPGPVHERPSRGVRGSPGARSPGPDVRLRMDQPDPLQQRLHARLQLLPEQRVQRRGQARGARMAAALAAPQDVAGRPLHPALPGAHHRRSRHSPGNPSPCPGSIGRRRLEVVRPAPGE
ncbi:hypothetical protein D3C78_1451730 [compost metagenome]